MWLGTANGIVQSWIDTQVVAVVASGASSGSVRILQNGVMSNTIPFNVTTPRIASISPGSGSSGTSITITGTGFGASQSTGGTVLLGSIAGQVISWSDTQVVATVAPGSLTGLARLYQNGYPSNALSFRVPVSGASLTLVPYLMNLSVGETARFQAVDAAGNAVAGLSWLSSDTTVASLSTDDPPILTALTPGHVTITAGTATADVTIFAGALSLGTIKRVNPGNGSGVSKIVPAVPGPFGLADVFSFQGDGSVQAITSEGNTAWTADASNALGMYSTILPDFQGGLILAPWNGSAYQLYRLDGMTGQRRNYSVGNFFYNVKVHTDGTIFVVVQNPVVPNTETTSSVVGLDLFNGAEKFRISPPGLKLTYADMIIAGDGSAYLPYVVTNDGDVQLKILQVGSNGSSKVIHIATHGVNEASPFTFPGGGPGDQPGLGSNYAPSMISNGADGVLFSWSEYISKGAFAQPDLYMRLAAVSSAGTVSVSPGPRLAGQEQIPVIPVLQREDGTFVGTAWIGGYYDSWNQMTKSMVAFDAGGNILWSVPNEQPEIATADGGVISKSGMAYNQSGSAGGQSILGGNVSPGWLGSAMGTAYSPYSGVLASVAGPQTIYAGTFFAFAGGNASGNGTAIGQRLKSPSVSTVHQIPNEIVEACSINVPRPTCGNLNAIELVTTRTPDSIFQDLVQTFLPLRSDSTPKNTIQTFFSLDDTTPINITAEGQILKIKLSWLGVLVSPFYVSTERVDLVNRVISVVTLEGHPLAGWRYWRVYANGTNRVVIETGAYDSPAPGILNLIGYYVTIGTIKQAWKEYMKYIQGAIGAPEGTNLQSSLGGIPLTNLSRYNGPLVNGYWDYSGTFTNYIKNHVCLSTACN